MESRSDPSEETAIRGIVQSYIDGFLGSDTTLLRRAFSPDANLIAASEGKVQVTPTASWFDRIERRVKDGAKLPRATSCISGIDQQGDAAIARVDLEFPEYRFTDYLSLLKSTDGWRVVNKIYTTSG